MKADKLPNSVLYIITRRVVMLKSVLIVSGLVLISGCASTLKVYDASNNEAKGVPINVPQLMEVTTTTSYKVAKGNEQYKDLCTPEVSSKLEFLPLGERYYITFDPATLGDGEFSVEFNDKGLVKSVTLNSKASAGAEQANALISAALPFIKAPKSVSEKMSLIGENDSAQKLKAKYCLKAASKVSSIKKVDIQ